MSKTIFVTVVFFSIIAVRAQQLAVSQFNAGSHQNAQTAYIIGEAFNNEYQFISGSLAESILAGAAPSVLAVADPTRNLLKIYPNPVTQQRFFIETPANTKGYLYNVSGRLLRTVELKSGKNTVDVTGLPTGLYHLKTDAGFTAKILVR